MRHSPACGRLDDFDDPDTCVRRGFVRLFLRPDIIASGLVLVALSAIAWRFLA